jgi:diguanylate cyclase (GGDEF)-like protein/PAS domain S-box-containing protein
LTYNQVTVDKKILRLLIVDDSPDDTEVAATTLRRAGYMLKTQRVQDLTSMQAALDKGQWDVVLCEYSLPHFGAQLALDLLRRTGHEIPFLVVTRNIKDTDLAKIMRAGALDVIMKNQPFRLPPVIERELRVHEERRAYRQATQALQETENKHRAIVDGSLEAIGYCQDGMHVDANKAYLDLFGYGNKGELEGVPVMNLIDKNDQSRFKDYLRKTGGQSTQAPQEFLATKQDGARLHVELIVSAIVLNGERCVQIVANDISKRKAVENRLLYLNQHDPLTGLFNRHFFIQEINKTLEQVKKDGSRSGLIYIDLNQLKEINDEYGHAAGDRLLLKVARMFREKLGETAVLGRFGGDEFAVLLHKIGDTELRKTANVLHEALKETSFSEGGKTFSCSGTLGVVAVGKDTENAQKILSDAYHASQQARPRKPEPVFEAAPETPKVEAKKPELRRVPVSDWAARLQTALDKNGLDLAYQPIVNLHGDPAEYFEVLVRLLGDKGESISAGEFMPAAEQSGLAPAVDRWVAREAVRALAEMHREKRRTTFFVNLCPAALHDPELLILIQKQLHESGVKPEYLALETDEATLMANPAEAKTFLQTVKKIGCRFSVDNFGNNLSSLNQLRDLPIDFLKIAGMHIRNLATDTVAQTSLKALIQVAKAIDKKVIAKFVEKAEDLAILWNLGVDYVQGNYFQEADTPLSYEFGGEATLSSDPSAPQWATGNGR